MEKSRIANKTPDGHTVGSSWAYGNTRNGGKDDVWYNHIRAEQYWELAALGRSRLGSGCRTTGQTKRKQIRLKKRYPYIHNPQTTRLYVTCQCKGRQFKVYLSIAVRLGSVFGWTPCINEWLKQDTSAVYEKQRLCEQVVVAEHKPSLYIKYLTYLFNTFKNNLINLWRNKKYSHIDTVWADS
jgi:hypothetical protein